MKKVLAFGMFFLLGAYCFAQELVVTRIENNFSNQWAALTNGGRWPSGDSGRQWNIILNRYNLVRLDDTDPFATPNPLIDRIINLSYQRAKDNEDPYVASMHIDPSTIYLTMGNRRFICFLYFISYKGGLYAWVYEVK